MAINILSQTQQPGQQQSQDVIAGAPTQDLQRRVPQAEGLDSLLEAAPAPEAAPVAAGSPETALNVDEAGLPTPEPTAVPTIAEREAGPTDASRWGARGLPPVASVDGGLQERATRMAEKFGNNNNWEGGLAIEPGASAQSVGLSGALARVGAITEQAKVAKPDGTAGFTTALDPMFLEMGSAVTENVMTRLAQGQTATPDFQADKSQAVEREIFGPEDQPAGVVAKSQGNVEIGMEANREYQRMKNAAQGLPTDQYTDISPEDAAVLGDALKEMYAISNPNEMKRVRPEGSEGQVYYELTPLGQQELNSDAAKFKRAQLFPGVNVRPSKSPIKGQIKSEVGRVATRKDTGHVKGTPAGRDVIEESTRNMSTIPNVVNKQRMKILFATALPALMSQETTAWSTINNFGADQVKKFNADAKKLQREGQLPEGQEAVQKYTADMIRLLKGNIAQGIRAVAMERKGANYLSYYIQNFNGRTAPQQSFFDPTTSKAVRFVTTNAVPASTAKPRVERNLRQMYAMMLVKDADAALPAEREVMLKGAEAQLERWGDTLQQAMDEAITDEAAEQLAQQIEEGRPLNEMNIPELKIQDPELVKQIEKKGEDGPHFIDGLIDFANYAKAKRAGRPYHSYFNAYMDGKTNGIASNGIQMGSEEVALKTGVMRTGTKQLLDDGDIRDELMKQLNEQLDSTGLQEADPNFYTVAKSVFNYRQLAKDTTMTFGYGKELESFKQDVGAALDLMIEDDPAVAAAMEAMMATGDRDTLVESLHKEYVNFLAAALSEEAMESRPLMRGAATMFALIDKPMTLTTATGFELRLGGEITTGEHGEGYTEQEYGLYEDGKKRTVTAQRYGTRSSAIAAKGEQGVGSRAWGGSLPGPVQSLDAATIALTTTGKSWDRLKANSDGNPYFHHVYDAVKVDANGFDVVLEEVNKNWLNASMDWSYLESTQNSLAQAMQEFNQELKQYPDALPINTGATDEFAMFGILATETESMSGKVGPWELAKRLTKIRADDDFISNLEIATNIMKHMKKNGYNQDAPTIGDFKLFMKLMAHHVQLNQRMTSMINKTNKQKQKLRQKIKSSAPRKEDMLGYDVSHGLQYYAH